jgi:predicted ester cyclase
MAMLAPDRVFSDNGLRLFGRDAVLAATRRYFHRYPDLRLDLISLYVASNAVLTEWRVQTSRHEELTGIPAARSRAHPTGSRVDEFNDDGLVRRSPLYLETGQMLSHFGISPVEGADARWPV